jgi:hypothetical protein
LAQQALPQRARSAEPMAAVALLASQPVLLQQVAPQPALLEQVSELQEQLPGP